MGRRGAYRKAMSCGLGMCAAFAAVLALGEAYARLRLPSDIRQHLGEHLTNNNIYKPDPILGADYRSYEDFHAENIQVLTDLGPLDSPMPTWLFFGNSFVQGPGMLADTARAARPDKRIFNIGKNVDLPLRVAQARLLLEAGLRPQRIFFILLPHDLWSIGRRPLSFIEVTAEGAIATRMRWPDSAWGNVVAASRIMTIAWIRSGRATPDPGFDWHLVAGVPSPRVAADLADMLGVLAELFRQFGVPTTVVAVPNREQIFGKSGFGFQEALKELCALAGLDYFDARHPLVDVADKAALFESDWHFSARGNALLLGGLLEHVEKRAVHRAP